VTRSTLNLFSMIGLVMLMGLVTKNAILLVDYANHVRKTGVSDAEALLQAGMVRMRPIMMTTAAMIFGMLPMALALDEGGEIQAPMGRAIIGGVITSTLLTLIVVPVLYSYIDELGAWAKRRFRARSHAVGGSIPAGDAGGQGLRRSRGRVARMRQKFRRAMAWAWWRRLAQAAGFSSIEVPADASARP
jgi:predicted RND superfamily exporter protein